MSKIKKWHIYLANLDPTIGSEQGKTRPVLVISENEINDILNCVNILPITSRKPSRIIYPNEVLLPVGSSALPKEPIILCHQIRTVDKLRLSKSYGSIENNDIENAVFDAICFQFGIPN